MGEAPKRGNSRIVIGEGISVAVHDLPRAVLTPEDGRHAQGVGARGCAVYRGSGALDGRDVTEITADAGCNHVNHEGLAVQEGCGEPLEGGPNLVPPAGGDG